MSSHRILFHLLCWTVALALTALSTVHAKEPTWHLVESEEVHGQLTAWLSTTSLSPSERAKVLELWWDLANREEKSIDLLDRLVLCLASADERSAQLVDFCAGTASSLRESQFPWLANSQTAPLIRYNLRLYFARWLVQEGFYDEALAWTEGLTTTDVVAPASLLFYRAIAQHRLVLPEKAIDSLQQLLEQENDLPERYQKLAQLMRHDLAGLEEESLDHIARRMADIGRRLGQGRSDEPVQKVEQGVLDSLDKLIKKIEDQQQQQAQQQGSGSGSGGTPMQESRLAELKAEGKVDRRDIGNSVDWGDLPPKEREQAMQEIGRDFPSHYREVIEEYFRRLASEETDG